MNDDNGDDDDHAADDMAAKRSEFYYVTGTILRLFSAFIHPLHNVMSLLLTSFPFYG